MALYYKSGKWRASIEMITPAKEVNE